MRWPTLIWDRDCSKVWKLTSYYITLHREERKHVSNCLDRSSIGWKAGSLEGRGSRREMRADCGPGQEGHRRKRTRSGESDACDSREFSHTLRGLSRTSQDAACAKLCNEHGLQFLQNTVHSRSTAVRYYRDIRVQSQDWRVRPQAWPRLHQRVVG